jgi:hypothetical protein
MLFIKASGYALSQISETDGFVTINNKLLKEDIETNKIKDVIKYNINGTLRASIETYMHSILKKYTIHIHPIQINKYLILRNSKELIKSIISGSLILDYITPGIDVCKEILKCYEGEEIIFLLNHGIIITSDDYENILINLEILLNKFEKLQTNDFGKYKNTNKISSYVNTENTYDNVCYLCEDKIVTNYLIYKRYLFNEKIAFPDTLVYCGSQILFINKLEDISAYINNFNENPKIIIYNEHVYMINKSIRKCKETEDVFKANLLILDIDEDKTYLTKEEICFLNNWDAEKYRKLL